MLNANTIKANKAARREAIKSNKKRIDPLMVDYILTNYKFLGAAAKASLAQRIAEFHDNSQTPSPFYTGGA